MKIFNQIIVLLLVCFTSVVTLADEDVNELTATLDILLDDESVLHTNQKKHNLLHLAVMTRDIDAVRYFVNRVPVLIRGKDEDGDTPFLLSCLLGNLEIIDFLLSSEEAGVDINESNDSKNTCLHYLAFGLHMNLIPYMISKGADPTLPDVNGDIPAHLLLRRLQSRGIMENINFNFIEPEEIIKSLNLLDA